MKYLKSEADKYIKSSNCLCFHQQYAWYGLDFKDLDSCAKKEVTINLARVQKRFVAVSLNYQSPLFCVGAEGLFHD